MKSEFNEFEFESNSYIPVAEVYRNPPKPVNKKSLLDRIIDFLFGKPPICHWI